MHCDETKIFNLRRLYKLTMQNNKQVTLENRNKKIYNEYIKAIHSHNKKKKKYRHSLFILKLLVFFSKFL